MLRFAAGIATFTAAVTSVTVPAMLAYAPFLARSDRGEPFGDWKLSGRLDDAASSPWAWALLVVAPVVLIILMHLLNALPGRARSAEAWLTLR